MKHRDRVQMALNHEEPDRCPFSVGFTPEFAARLRENLQVRGGSLLSSQSGGYSYDLERASGVDMLLTFVGWANSYYQEGDTYTDEWGIGWRSVTHQTRFGEGSYTEPVFHPLAEDDAIESYRPPDPNRPELYEEPARVIREYKDEYWIVGAVVCTVYEAAWALRGLQQSLIDFVKNPDLLKRILDIPYRYHLTAAKKLVELGVDMIWIGDDVGAQRGMLISPGHWREFLKPLMANFIAELKAINPDVLVAYHSDGVIDPIIPDFIEIGLDVLNPIQPACMDPARLKQQYGDRLSFWGSLDIQHTLPHGMPDEVRAEVRQRLETIGRGGGLILGPSHYVQLDTPLENFWAMVDAVTGTPYSELT